MKYLLLALALTACAPSVVKADPPVVIVLPAPVIVTPPGPVIVPAPVPIPSNPLLDVQSAALVTVTTDGQTVHIALSDPAMPVWLRVRLPNGSISEVTTSPAGEFIGLYSALPSLDLKYLPGLSIEAATNLVTPDWTVAAVTK